MRNTSNEIFVGTKEGVIKVRSIRRKGTNEERWNTIQLDEMKGTPWEPQPGRDSHNVESKIIVHREPPPEPIELPKGVELPRRKNRFHIRPI